MYLGCVDESGSEDLVTVAGHGEPGVLEVGTGE